MIELTGNFKEILVILQLPAVFGDPTPKFRQLIDKDLPRSSYIDFDDRSFEHCRETWNAETISPAYNQGHITGSFFECFLQVRADILEDHSFFERNNQIRLNFAYFDDEGLPCGLSICASVQNPALWCVAIIRNTIVEPEDREVTVFCDEAINLHQENRPSLASKQEKTSILSALHSKKIQDLVTNLISDEGKLDHQAIQRLNQRLLPGRNIDNKDLKKASLDEFIQQIKKYFPESADFDRLLNNLNNYQSNNLDFYQDGVFEENLNQLERDLKALILSQMTNGEAASVLYEIELNKEIILIELEAYDYDHTKNDPYIAKVLFQEAAFLRENRDDYQENIQALDYAARIDYAKKILAPRCQFDDYFLKVSKNLAKIETIMNKTPEMEGSFEISALPGSLRSILGHLLKIKEANLENPDRIKECLDVLEILKGISNLNTFKDQNEEIAKLSESIQLGEEFLEVMTELSNYDPLKNIFQKKLLNFRLVLERCSYEPLRQQGMNLLENIDLIASELAFQNQAADWQALSEILNCAQGALLNPSKDFHLKELDKLSKKAPGHRSQLWQIVGLALVAFTILALVVAGVLSALPTGGIGLGLCIVGVAVLFGIGLKMIHEGATEKKLAKALTQFRSAFFNNPDQEGKPAVVDELGLDLEHIRHEDDQASLD